MTTVTLGAITPKAVEFVKGSAEADIVFGWIVGAVGALVLLIAFLCLLAFLFSTDGGGFAIGGTVLFFVGMVVFSLGLACVLQGRVNAANAQGKLEHQILTTPALAAKEEAALAPAAAEGGES